MRKSVDLPQPDGPHEHGEGAVRNLDVHAAHGMDLAEALVHAAQPDPCHGSSYPLTAPMVMPRTRKRCSVATAKNTGSVPSTESAAIFDQKVDWAP